MNQSKQLLGLALAGGMLCSGAANATSICDLDILTFNFTNTGVCGEVITTLDGVVVQDLDESATSASAMAEQGLIPPAAGANGASGKGKATFPNAQGIGGTVGAAASVSADGTAAGEISSVSSGFYIGEFIADDGQPGNNPFNLGVHLTIDGTLFAHDAQATMALIFAAVDANGVVLDSLFGFADLANLGTFSLFTFGFDDPNPYTIGPCSDPLDLQTCVIDFQTTEDLTLAGLVDGDVFGLFLTIVAIATLPNGGTGNAYLNFADTVELSFSGGTVTALPGTIAAPEPASMALLLAGVLAIGWTRRRRRV